MLVMAAYLLFSSPSVKTVMKSFQAIHIIAVIFSIYTIIVKINPEIYWNNIFPYLGSYTQERALFLMPLGYGVPIGGSTSYGVYVITLALFVNFGHMFIFKEKRVLKEMLFIIASNVLYITAILLVNRRSEVLALIGTLIVLFIIYIIPFGKKELKYRMISFGSTLLLMGCVVVLLAHMGHLGRYSVTLEVLIPPVNRSEMIVTEDTATEDTVTEDTATEDTVTEDTIPEINIPKTDLSHGRFSLWKKGMSLFSENPVFGIGWMQFRQTDGTSEDYVHNTYIQWLCETGIVGFVLIIVPILIMLFINFRQCIQFIRNYKLIPFELRLINFVALAAHGYFLALNFIDPTFYHLYFFVFYSYIIILADVALRNKVQSLKGDR